MKDVNIAKLTPAIGAEITDVDLTALTDAQFDRIYKALMDHLVLFFPAQSLTPDAQLDFARRFGELDKPHPIYPHADDAGLVTLLEHDESRPPDTADWHTDLSFYKTPPDFSILQAVSVPDAGGDTMWSSLYAAYDALPDGLRDYIGTLDFAHDMGDFRNQYYDKPDPVAALNAAMTKIGCSIHPAVKRHPVTGRPFLYANAAFTRHVVDMKWSQSQRLLSFLFESQNTPEHQVRYKWADGTVAIWDNRVTQHYAIADYLPSYRRMHRVTVVKDTYGPQIAKAA